MTDRFREGRARPVTRVAALATVVVAAALASAWPAGAAPAPTQRFASPTSTTVTGSCPAEAPCRLDHAVNGAAAGDEVIVQPGTYSVTYPVAATAAVNVHGVAGEPRPRLIGSTSVGPVVSMAGGGSLSHLYVEANKNLAFAVELGGAVGSDLELYSSKGGAAELNGVSGGTVLRDSVARSAGTSAVQAKDGATVGPAKVLNVTAIASEAATTAVKGKQTVATTTVRNTIARGAKDVDATGAKLAVDHSNFRPATSSGYIDGGSNQSGEPAFLDRANGDLRVLAGSGTIDAGTAADPDLGATDPDGRGRTLDAAPDIGAYEYAPPPSGTGGPGSGPGPGGDGPSVLPPPAPPAFGATVGLGTVSGSVRVRTPGGSGFIELHAGASVPVNSTIDATSGVVALTSAREPNGATQTGSFWGGVFRVEQRASGGGYTDLVLQGGDFGHCRRRAARSRLARAARRASAARRLWGRDRHGRFRTRGRNGHAVVRGTEWLTEDRCDGTFFAVREGEIEVRPKAGGRRVRLRAGGRYLARAPRGRR